MYDACFDLALQLAGTGGQFLRCGDMIRPQIAELPLVPLQPNDLLPHGKRDAPEVLLPVCPSQQIEIPEIKRVKTCDFSFRPSRALSFDAVALSLMRKVWHGLCAAFPLGSQPHADILLRVTVAQAIQPDRPLTARWQHRHIFAVGVILHHIPAPPQKHQECLVCIRLSDDAVNVAANNAADSGPACVFRLPFGVVLSFALRHDHRQVIFTAQGIGHTSHSEVVAAWTGVVLLAIHEGYGVHHHMIVEMGFIQVGADDHLVAVTK